MLCRVPAHGAARSHCHHVTLHSVHWVTVPRPPPITLGAAPSRIVPLARRPTAASETDARVRCTLGGSCTPPASATGLEVERIKNSATLAEAGVRASASHWALSSKGRSSGVRDATQSQHVSPGRHAGVASCSAPRRERALPVSTLQVQPELGQHARQPGLAQA